MPSPHPTPPLFQHILKIVNSLDESHEQKRENETANQQEKHSVQEQLVDRV